MSIHMSHDSLDAGSVKLLPFAQENGTMESLYAVMNQLPQQEVAWMGWPELIFSEKLILTRASLIDLQIAREAIVTFRVRYRFMLARFQDAKQRFDAWPAGQCIEEGTKKRVRRLALVARKDEEAFGARESDVVEAAHIQAWDQVFWLKGLILTLIKSAKIAVNGRCSHATFLHATDDHYRKLQSLCLVNSHDLHMTRRKGLFTIFKFIQPLKLLQTQIGSEKVFSDLQPCFHRQIIGLVQFLEVL